MIIPFLFIISGRFLFLALSAFHSFFPFTNMSSSSASPRHDSLPTGEESVLPLEDLLVWEVAELSQAFAEDETATTNRSSSVPSAAWPDSSPAPEKLQLITEQKTRIERNLQEALRRWKVSKSHNLPSKIPHTFFIPSHPVPLIPPQKFLNFQGSMYAFCTALCEFQSR